MAAPQPTAPYRQLPPELPSLPEISPKLSNYLRTFSLWVKKENDTKLSSATAEPTVLLQAADAVPGSNPAVWKLQIKTDGTLQSVPVALGSGVESAPVPSGGGWAAALASYLPLVGGTLTGLLTVSSVTFSALPVNAANDAAAATAGVPVGGVYRNGSILMVRTV